MLYFLVKKGGRQCASSISAGKGHSSLDENAFVRQLAPGERLLAKASAFLYKDSSVAMAVEFQQLSTGFFGGTNMALAKVTGPGRVGIQSMYVHHHTGSGSE